jgi:hypothetical protein
MGDSCIGQVMIAGAFGGVFGALVGGGTSTYSATLSNSGKATLRYMGKTSYQYALITSTFAGAYCAAEGITMRKGPHNAVLGGVAAGAVGALLKNNIKFGLAFGGVTAIAMGAVDFAGGTLDTRGESTLERFKIIRENGKASA